MIFGDDDGDGKDHGKQFALGFSARESDWLIGRNLLGPAAPQVASPSEPPRDAVDAACHLSRYLTKIEI